jgi:endoplasmic reticulum-Golgi intermediate compartment protein 1
MALAIFEVQKFINADSHAELIIDMTHRDDFVDVNLDVTFPNIPCDALSLDEEDILGTHKTDILGDVKKKRLSKTG